MLKIHPAAEMFPLMSPDELRELAEDIQKNGLVEWPTLASGRKRPARSTLLDGRNRLDALAAARRGTRRRIRATQSRRRTRPLWRSTDSTARDPNVPIVVSANIRRRRLDAEQKRELITKLLTAGSGDRATGSAAKTIGVDRQDGRQRCAASGGGNWGRFAQFSAKTVGADGKARPATKAPSKAKAATPKAEVPKPAQSTPPPQTDKPFDLIAEFKKFCLRHLMSLDNISEHDYGATLARTSGMPTFCPDRAGTTTVKEAADERVH